MYYTDLVTARRNRGWLAGRAIGIDRSNSLSSGLLAAWTPGASQRWDVSGNQPASQPQNSPPAIASQYGNALKLNGTNQFIKAPGNYPHTRGATLFLHFKLLSTPVGESFMLLERDTDDNVAANLLWGLSMEMNNTNVRFQFCNTAPTATLLIGATSLTVGNWYSVAGTYSVSANRIRLYENGKEDSNSPATVSGTMRGSGFQYTIGGLGLTGGRYANVAILLIFIFNRPLSSGEVSSLSNDPYQFLIFPEDVVAAHMMTGVRLVTSSAVGAVPYPTIWWSGL